MISQSNVAGLIGARVDDADGEKVGTVAQIFVDPASGLANWASVKTGLFGMSETFVPLAEAAEIGDTLRLPYAKAFIKDAPRVDAGGELTHDAEAELQGYYTRDAVAQAPDAHGRHRADPDELPRDTRA
ncbi:PRC-barrel domain-containing protein [Leifsonia sp. NPDC058248]|uniref:PRC-barrel domain-containing protein n=1 Tax=Leifsonia sp. NPDC058248 TaxID=3346402 RepID=UPI0036DC8B2B